MQEKSGKIRNINKVHPEVSLLRISHFLHQIKENTLLTKTKKREMLKQVQHGPYLMTTRNNAFSLIELLIVVLIIGILAAIAVPQYQKAVVKSRFVEAMINLKAIGQAQQLCLLENPEGCSLDEMSVIPSVKRRIDPWEQESDNFWYSLATRDVEGHPVFGRTVYRKEDVCICYLQTGEFVVNQGESGCAPDPSFNYAKLLGLREVSTQECACC